MPVDKILTSLSSQGPIALTFVLFVAMVRWAVKLLLDGRIVLDKEHQRVLSDRDRLLGERDGLQVELARRDSLIEQQVQRDQGIIENLSALLQKKTK